MNQELVEQTCIDIEPRSTERLLAIWKENDREAWPDEVFEAIERVLIQRGVRIPPQKDRRHLADHGRIRAQTVNSVVIIACGVIGALLALL